MEFTKDIYFSDNLTENKTVQITYSGNLFKDNSESVTIVYGFGENWEHTTEQEMSKTDNGFTTNIEMKNNFDTFNFCFRNSNYVWDNNGSFNYISSITPSIEDVLSLETLETKEEQEINEALILELLDNLLDENINSSDEETLQSTVANEYSLEEILSSSLSSNHAEDSSYYVENLDSIVTSEVSENSAITFTSENLQQILDDILAEQEVATKEIIEEVPDYVWNENFDIDALVEDILNPVINCKTQEETETQFFSESTIVEEHSEPVGIEEPSLLQFEAKTASSEKSTGLVESFSKENNYLVSPRQLSRFYLIKKKIKLAFYKLFVTIPKLLSGEYNNSKD